MKKKALTMLLALLTTANLHAQGERETLQNVLKELEKVKSATYEAHLQSWLPGDTIATNAYTRIYKEFDNPADTTIGARFICYDGLQMKSAYDGTHEVTFYPENHGVIIDDFTWRDLPFRPITAPFFNYTKNIVSYALTTNDPIRTEWEERENDYHFRLTIEGLVVEFFGRAHHIPPYNNPDPLSVYELWIDKATMLPYKYRREMDYQTSAEAVSNVTLNTLDNNDFTVYSLIPEDYKVRTVQENQQRRQQQKEPLLNQPAPVWTLNDADGKAHSLNNLKGRVVLLNLTGIGCGPCAQAISFLNSLRKEYSEEELSLVSIDTWLRKPHSIRVYIQQHGISYPLLEGKEHIAKDYRTGGAAPFFFLLDENRIIRRIVRGYTPKETDEMLRRAIKELLIESSSLTDSAPTNGAANHRFGLYL